MRVNIKRSRRVKKGRRLKAARFTLNASKKATGSLSSMAIGVLGNEKTDLTQDTTESVSNRMIEAAKKAVAEEARIVSKGSGLTVNTVEGAGKVVGKSTKRLMRAAQNKQIRIKAPRIKNIVRGAGSLTTRSAGAIGSVTASGVELSSSSMLQSEAVKAMQISNAMIRAAKGLAMTAVKATKWVFKSVRLIVKHLSRIAAPVMIGVALFLCIVLLAYQATKPVRTAWRFITGWFAGPSQSIVEAASSSYNLQMAMNDLDKEFQTSIADLKASGEYDSVTVSGHQANWRDVLIVFGIEACSEGLLSDENDLNDLSIEAMSLLNRVFWMMNDISQRDNGDSLSISISPRDAREMSKLLQWDDEMINGMEEGLSTDADKDWSFVPIPGSYVSSSGYAWPCPGHADLTTYFGEADAIYGMPHRGIDIAAPEGSDIIATASGTVITATWNNSYGNYVKINHGNGLITVYAHASKLLVQEGQKVRIGDVIALVGSTGDSTGNHLHFEWQLDGELKNPLDYVHYGSTYSTSEFSETDIELIALLTMGEAEGESELGKRLVIDTVLNRLDSGDYGNTVHSVVYAQYQFSGMGRVNYAPDSVRQLVIEEINNRTNYEVYYFRTDYYHPFGKNLFKVGNHYFSSK